ncbi:MAG: excinuclease ABC subunit UvrA, partial [Sandaracinaceae bacterium]
MHATRLRGARTNNLQGIDLDLEPGSLVAVVGPSGAGKSSLAFGTLYAEGQRRYVESFSAYARQFLERLARPPVDELDPIAASVAVDRQAPVRTSRSTVGTMTEVADYAKSLWARAAALSCPGCGRPVSRDAPEAIADEVIGSAEGAKLTISYPLEVPDAATFLGIRDALIGDGYRRIVLDGAVRDLDDVKPSELVAAGAVDVLADRAVARPSERARLVDSIEAAMSRAAGRADVTIEGAGQFKYSRGLHCAHCDRSFRDATEGMFSFNHAVGACEACRGFGRTLGVDWARVFDEPKKTLADGAIRPWRGKSTQWERRYLVKHAERAGVPMDVPFEELTDAQRAWLIEGEGDDWKKQWGGLRRWFDWLQTRAYKMHVRVLLSRYRSYDLCASCGGTRLKPESLAWKIGGASIADMLAMTASDAASFLDRELAGRDAAIELLRRETMARLRTLEDVGLGYLTLDRASRTLSGGEAQRVALTGALGASLTGALFVLDEPTVGLHPHDVERLAKVVGRLGEQDNTVILVEHDERMIRSADRVVELGPGAGADGGRIVFDGTPRALAGADTATGRAMRAPGSRAARAPRTSMGAITLRGARGNNLCDVDLTIPRGVLTAVTGVSGSGKSSLIGMTLVPAARAARGEANETPPLPFDAIDGIDALSGVVHVDQSPLGRTSRGNPATYLKIWDAIRKRFAAEPRAKELGLRPGSFSFNAKGGRCEACAGMGAETVEMQFLADVTFSCPECGGRRFVGEVLEVTYDGLTIADVLELTAAEAAARPGFAKDIKRAVAPLGAVGLGYLRLGQPLNTLSGGEAQRLKLAATVLRARPGSLIVLDEPTAGLHHDDVTPLLHALDALVERGDTVVVVEHDMRLAAFADHVIDLGPGPGKEGGRIVAEGPPRAVAQQRGSITAPFLAEELGLAKSTAPPPRASRTKARTKTDLTVTRAREHNLKDVSVAIAKDQLVVVTGPSGSGKSTLAFDVIFSEGQRRYLETLSPFARQYMPQLPRPDVDRVSGVPPTVSLEQRVTRGGANSTVATVTEIAHYARLIWATVGVPHCPEHGEPIAARTPESIASILAERDDRALTVLAPLVKGQKGLHRDRLAKAYRAGYRRARIDGAMVELTRSMALERFVEHDIDLVVGEARANDAGLAALLATAAQAGKGEIRILDDGELRLFSTVRACPRCGRGFPELDPRFFSFNTRQGACEDCEGKGEITTTVGRGKSKREVVSPCERCGGSRLS